MGVLDKFLDAIKLNDDYDEDDGFLDDELLDEEDDADFLDDDFDEKPKKKFFDKFSKKKEIPEEEDMTEEPAEEEHPVKSASRQTSAAKQSSPAPASSKTPVKQERPERQARPATSSKITPMRSNRKASQGLNMEVCVIKPSSMEDTREIADTLLENSTVILNLEGIDVELAQRIIDFTSGACYSLGGTLQKVSSYIFVLGPYNVDITGDLQNILGGSAPSVRAGY